MISSSWLRGRTIAGLVLALIAAVALAAMWLRPGSEHAEREPPDIAVENLEPHSATMIRQARRMVQQDPRSADRWGHLGHVLWTHEFISEAARCYLEAEQRSPRDVRWPYLRSLCLERHEPDASLECMRRAAALDRSNLLPNIQMAEMLLGRGHLHEADEYLAAARSAEPSHPRVLLALGRLAYLQGELNAALRWTSQAAAADPDRRSIRLLLCQIYQRLGDHEAVDRELALIQTMPPVVPYYEWPDPILAEVARLRSDSSAVAAYARQLIEAGQIRQAIGLLQQAGGAKSRNAQVLLALGQAYMKSGELERAQQVLLGARASDPGSPPIHYELGNAARLARRHQEAVDHYQEAVRLEPAYAIAYYYLSRSQIELGDLDAAITALQDACRYVPDNRRVQRELVELLWRSGRRDEATQQLENTLQLDPNDSETRQLFDRLQLDSPSAGR